MIEEIKKGLFRLKLPIPNSPLKALNCYIIKGSDRNLIIDTGMNCTEAIEAAEIGLKKLEIDLNKTDLFFTHEHPDHTGLLLHLHRPGCKIYGSKEDSAILCDYLNGNDRSFVNEVIRFAHRNGFEMSDAESEQYSSLKLPVPGLVDFTCFEDGDILEYAEYKLEVIKTPGHSAGHLCLYDREKKLFFSGDHILGDITPNIAIFNGTGNPLKDYLNSIDKVRHLNVELTVPGHRSLIYDFEGRIKEIIDHHNQRCHQIIRALEKGSANIYQLASQIDWDMNYEHFYELAEMQRFFAFAETAAHVEYLYDRGEIKRREAADGIIVYHST